MPARRLKMDAPAGVQMMASADADRVSIVLWGAENEHTEVALDWVNLPFHEGTVAVHLLDENFFDAYDGHLVPNREMPLTSEDLTLTLSPDTVAYIEINRAYTKTVVDETPCYDYVRTHYFFENRDKNTIVWYDERTGKTVLGMGNNEYGLAVCASEINMKQDVLHVEAITEALVNPQSYRAIRVDFATAAGYEKAVVYANHHDAAYPALPFGTGRPADAVRPWPQVSLDISLAQHAPEGWTGRLLVTFVLKDAGPDSWLELKLR